MWSAADKAPGRITISRQPADPHRGRGRYATCCLPQIAPLPAGEQLYVEKLTQSLPDFAFMTLLV